MQFIYKYRAVIALLLCTTFISGCWDRKEINDVAFVIGIAVDKEGTITDPVFRLLCRDNPVLPVVKEAEAARVGINPGLCYPIQPNHCMVRLLKVKGTLTNNLLCASPYDAYW